MTCTLLLNSLHPSLPQFAYRASCASLERLGEEWKKSLGVNGVQDEVAVAQLESAVGLYLRRVSTTHDISTIIEVCPGSTVVHSVMI